MAANRYAGLKHGFVLATAISATLSGCASVEYDKVAEQKRLNHTVSMPKTVSETAYATAGAQPGTVSQLNASPMVPVAMGYPAGQPGQPAGVQTAALGTTQLGANQPMQPLLMQPIVAPGSQNPLVAGEKPPAGSELAYAPPALVVLPQPRPDIIAAANSIPTAGGDTVGDKTEIGSAPQSSAQKDVETLDEQLASANPSPGQLNPLMSADVAVPTPRPANGPMGLEAYADTPSMLALDSFDTSGPKDLSEGIAEPGAAPSIAPSSRLQSLIHKYASLYKVPEALVHRVIHRESRYNPAAYSRGNYGLMQIRYNTARSLGYVGSPSGLFDAETNLKYAVKYLRGAFMVADNNHDNAVRLYARGYYYDAKRKGLLAQVQ